MAQLPCILSPAGIDWAKGRKYKVNQRRKWMGMRHILGVLSPIILKSDSQITPLPAHFLESHAGQQDEKTVLLSDGEQKNGGQKLLI